METLVYEMEMDDFGIALLANDKSFKVEILYELERDTQNPLQLKYMVKVTETRQHEEGIASPD